MNGKFFLTLALKSLSRPSLVSHDLTDAPEAGRVEERPWAWLLGVTLSKTFHVPKPPFSPLYNGVIELGPSPSQVIVRNKWNRGCESHPNTMCNYESRFAVRQRTSSNPF